MKTSKRISDILINNSIFIAIAILVIITAVQYPLFIKNAPLDLLKRSAAYVIMALGMGCIMLIGGIDLSAGRMMGLASLVAASFLQNGYSHSGANPYFATLPVSVVLIMVLLIGIIIGCINGFFVGKFKLHPYIVTLSVQLMLYGSMLCYLDLRKNGMPHLIYEYKGLITNTVEIGDWSIPNFVWYAIAVVVLMWAVWKYTPLGKKMRLYGENHEAAKTLNINPLAITVTVFAMAGALYGLNGFIEPARVGGPGASAGRGAEFDAILACMLGGFSMKGGMGKISGIVIGVILVQLISVCFQWLSINVNLVYIIKGVIILWAVTIDARKNYTGSGPAIWKWK